MLLSTTSTYVVVVRSSEPRIDAALGPPRAAALEGTDAHDAQLDAAVQASRLQPYVPRL